LEAWAAQRVQNGRTVRVWRGPGAIPLHGEELAPLEELFTHRAGLLVTRGKSHSCGGGDMGLGSL
jgi:hypothetical protein